MSRIAKTTHLSGNAAAISPSGGAIIYTGFKRLRGAKKSPFSTFATSLSTSPIRPGQIRIANHLASRAARKEIIGNGPMQHVTN
jgi:hypothetical protein